MRSSIADLKLANKRLEILQNALNAECHQQPNSMANGAGSLGGKIQTIFYCFGKIFYIFRNSILVSLWWQ